MKKTIIKMLTVFACFMFIFASLPMINSSLINATTVSATSNSTEIVGATFDTTTDYLFNKPLESIPRTYEAWVKAPTTADVDQVIFGNYKATGWSSVSVEIYRNGNPYFKWTEGGLDAEGKKINVASGSALFQGCDVRTGEWTHLAFTWSDSDVTLYVNGEMFRTKACVRPREDLELDQYFGVGTDNRHTAKPFLGEIKEVACYSDIRTGEEILADMESVDLNDEDIMFAFQPRQGQDVFNDLTGNGYRAGAQWFTEKDVEIPENYDFSFMVVGDTQYLTQKYPEQLPKVYDYILDKVDEKNVKHVIGVGDITNGDNEYEWDLASAQIARMNGKVNYSIIRGNHDLMSNGRDNSKSSRFDEYFGSTDNGYASQYTYCYEDENPAFRARNTIHFFSSSTHDYMLVALDFGANDNILKWASDIIEAHPGHNVIVTTHGYLDADGTTIDADSSSSPTQWGMTDSVGINTADDLWNKLISKHENIVMVMSGHILSDNIIMTQRTGDNGNVVSEFLVNAQGIDVSDPVGMVATFYVSESGEDITVEWYSTVKEKYLRTCNNFTFNVNVVDRVPEKTITFDANGGSGEMTAVNTYKDTYTLPNCEFTAPTYYAFKGWSLTPNGQLIESETIELTEDITLYAIYEKAVYTIAFNANGGTGEMQEGTCEQQIKVFSIPSCEFSAPAHHTFKGWSLSRNGQIIETSTIELNQDIILYAIWQRNTYAITFDANGGTGEMASASCNQDNYTLPTCSFTAPKHHTFKGWSLTSNGEVLATSSIENVADITLYAIWERNVYTITYNANGGTGEMASASCNQDTFILPLYTFTAPAHHCFKGWSTSANGEVITGSQVQIENNTTFYAVWERVVYIITFNANGGTGEMYNGACNQDDFTLPNCNFTAPKYYQFKGWSTSEDGDVIETDSIEVNSNLTLYAIYEKATYTITASAGENGSISPSGEVSVEAGSSYTFNFLANQDYKIKDVKINGESVGCENCYTFSEIDGNASIFVEFELIETNNSNDQKGGCGTIAFDLGGFTGGSALLILLAGAFIVVKSKIKGFQVQK